MQKSPPDTPTLPAAARAATTPPPKSPRESKPPASPTVQPAFTSEDQSPLRKLCDLYVASVQALLEQQNGRKTESKPNLQLIKAVEAKAKVTADSQREYHKKLLAYVGQLAAAGRTFAPKKDDALHRALQSVLNDLKANKAVQHLPAPTNKQPEPEEKQSSPSTPSESPPFLQTESAYDTPPTGSDNPNDDFV